MKFLGVQIDTNLTL